jgi:hypothetical protein
VRILLVNRFFGGSQTPTGRMLHDVAESLAAGSHEVVVLTSSGGYVDSEAALSAADHPRIDVRVIRQSTAMPRAISWGWFWLNALLRVPFMKWDRCVLLTDPPFLLFAAPLAKLIRGKARRIYWWTMDLYPEALHAAGIVDRRSLLYRTLRGITDWSLRSLDGVVALGTRQLGRLKQYSRWRDMSDFCIVVPPWDTRPLPKPPSGANPVALKLGWEERRVALYAGNLGEGHTFEEFVAAARWLHASGRTDWLFAFTVRGSRVPALKATAEGLPNVTVLDYLPESETAHLLWAARVHLISMKAGWEGVIVPSKLYGVMYTNAAVLFVGPEDADTAYALRELGRGTTLPSSSSGAALVEALDDLASWSPTRSSVPASGANRISMFVTAR